MKFDIGIPFNNKLDLIIWWSIAALLASLIFSTAMGQGLLILIILLGIYKIIKEKNISSLKNPVVFPFTVFIGVRILSIIFSEYPSLSITSLNKDLFFNLVFFVFLIALSQYDEKKIRLLIKILIIAAIIASIVGTAKVLLGISHRGSSTTSGYSTLGLFLCVIYALVFSLGKNNEFFPSRIWWFISLLIISTGILFTFNRLNCVSVAIVTLIIGLYKERIVFVFLLLLFTLVIILIPNISARFDQLIHFTQYMSDRDVIWRGAVMIWNEHPFLGFGSRTFHEIFPLYNELADKGVGGWHNEFLHIYMESGIPGLIAYLLIMFTIFYVGFKALKRFSSERIKFDLTLALLAGFTVFYLSSITSGFILDPITKVLFMFLLTVEGTLISSKLIKPG